jgi:hypothetical protein
MRSIRPVAVVYFCFILVLPAPAQQTPTTTLPSIQRDPQALVILQGAVAAMGGSVPSDSTANGTVTTVAGSLTENGSVIVLTRGILASVQARTIMATSPP